MRVPGDRDSGPLLHTQMNCGHQLKGSQQYKIKFDLKILHI